MMPTSMACSSTFGRDSEMDALLWISVIALGIALGINFYETYGKRRDIY